MADQTSDTSQLEHLDEVVESGAGKQAVQVRGKHAIQASSNHAKHANRAADSDQAAGSDQAADPNQAASSDQAADSDQAKHAVKGASSTRAKHAARGKHGKPAAANRFPKRVSLAIAAVVAALAIAVLTGTGVFENPQAPGSPSQPAFGQHNDAWAADVEPVPTEFSAIVEDGHELSSESVKRLTSASVDYAGNVQEMSQLGVMDGGCEIFSLAIALDSMGFEVTPEEIADEYLEIDGDYATGYSGSPYGMGGGFPAGIVAACNLYLADRGSSLAAHDLTGTSLNDLSALTNRGMPVLVWTTMFMEDPLFSAGEEGELKWYDNEHCVVVYALDDETVYVSDPLEGVVERDRAEFERIFEECGTMAVAIY